MKEPVEAAGRNVNAVPLAKRRREVTPEALTVDSKLLGLPLARPWRRGVAMALDGILIAILSNAAGVFLAAAAAAVLTRAAFRAGRNGKKRRVLRTASGLGGALAVFVLVVVGWGWLTAPSVTGDMVRQAGMSPDRAGRIAEESVREFEAMFQGMTAGAGFLALSQAESEDEALAAARRLADNLDELGAGPDEIAEVLREAGSEGRPWVAAAAKAVAEEYDAGAPSSPESSGMTRDSFVATDAARETGTGADPAPGQPLAFELPRDSLAVAYAGAVSAADSDRAAPLGRALGLALAADTIAELRDEVDDLEEEAAELEEEKQVLEDELTADREGGIMALLGSLVDDLGLGFGWAALYFTAFLVIGGGRTPGKMAARIRVVRLDGRGMTWWAAFERFGGYAAGLATGLLGYFQMLWDPNRQAVHDKIAGTVVVRTVAGAGGRKHSAEADPDRPAAGTPDHPAADAQDHPAADSDGGTDSAGVSR